MSMGTDFNDLHAASGIDAVSNQINAALSLYLIESDIPPAPPLCDTPPDYCEGDFMPPADSPAPPLYDEKPNLEQALQRYCFISNDAKIWDSVRQEFVKKPVLKDFIGAPVFNDWLNSDARRSVNLESVLPRAKKAAAPKVEGLACALSRYVYLNPSQQAWDKTEQEVVRLQDLKAGIAHCYDDWIKHPERQDIRLTDLVFDPEQRCADHCINRFKGLKMVASKNMDACNSIKRMLYALVNNNDEAYDWIIRWLAFPLQNVGKKMRTAVLMHSDMQGSGKSYFFDNVMRQIYGEYAKTVGQAEMESQYNDWVSETLWGVFEEVFSRANKYSSMGTVKQLITGAKIRINQKFLSGWEESNHLNCVYLSNEVQPFPIEPSDRRFLIIWPESKLLDEIKQGVDNDLANGGAEAFYGFLLGLDLTGFNEFTEPPMTDAKKRIIDFGRPSWDTFYIEWEGGELEMPFVPVQVSKLFKFFELWCRDRNEHSLSQSKFTGFIASRMRKRKDLHYKNKFIEGKGTFFIAGDKPDELTQSQWIAGSVIEWNENWEKIAGDK